MEKTVLNGAATKEILTCNGQQLRRMVGAGLAWLDKNKDHVNSLNVFPVPDGDTGTNMAMTMRSAYKYIADETTETHIGRMTQGLSRGALMGARGNSGVILSQIWRGFSKSVAELEQCDARGLAVALSAAADTAYKGVMKPVEGTILTIIRAVAEAADVASFESADLRVVLARMIERGNEALDYTPEQLPVLKQAGVVDSGGQGLLYLFEGMARYLDGDLHLDNQGVDLSSPLHQNGSHELSAQELARPDSGEIENPYDVQFIMLGQNFDVLKIRREIDAMGDSTVVVGDETTIKVHVHVEDPGEPISYGIAHGQITDVVVENMQLQMEEMIAASGHSNGAVADNSPPPPAAVELEPGQIGVVTIAPGAGLSDMFRSLGVTKIVEGGQTNNPSTEELFEAIQDIPSDKVIVLPNNKNIILAAEQARDLSTKNVIVVPTRTVPQGMSAMMSYAPAGNIDEVAEAMIDSADDVATGEITTAVRDVTLDGVEVAKGQLIGIANGKLCVCSSEMETVLDQTLTSMNIDDCEIVTLYYGADVTESQASTIVEQIEQLYPDVEVELHNGGQAHYYYILSAE